MLIERKNFKKLTTAYIDKGVEHKLSFTAYRSVG